jgi:hypothetical protein
VHVSNSGRDLGKIGAVKTKSHDENFVAADSFGLFVPTTNFNFSVPTRICQLHRRASEWIEHRLLFLNVPRVPEMVGLSHVLHYPTERNVAAVRRHRACTCST